MFIYTTGTIIKALTNTKHCSLNFKNYSVQISLFLYIHFFGLGPDAARTQYLTHTAPTSSTFTLLWNTRPMLCRSTTSPVACEHRNRLPVNTRIPRYPPAVLPWHGSLAIRWTPAVSPWEWVHRHLLSCCGVASSPSAHCLAVERLHRHPLSYCDMAPSPSSWRLLYRCTIARSSQGDPQRGEPHG